MSAGSPAAARLTLTCWKLTRARTSFFTPSRPTMASSSASSSSSGRTSPSGASGTAAPPLPVAARAWTRSPPPFPVISVSSVCTVAVSSASTPSAALPEIVHPTRRTRLVPYTASPELSPSRTTVSSNVTTAPFSTPTPADAHPLTVDERRTSRDSPPA
ncbi:hypothetical protein SUDANB123_04471 [Nocardiopsis dassonvillei]